MRHRLHDILPQACLLLGAAALVPLGCRHEGRREASDAPPTVRHAIHSARLRASMHDLDTWRYERLPPELRDETEERRRLRRIAQVADRMADSAAHLPDFLDGQELTDEERSAFVRLSRELQQACEALGSVARSRDRAHVADAWGRITATCAACHDRFREAPPLADAASATPSLSGTPW